MVITTRSLAKLKTSRPDELIMRRKIGHDLIKRYKSQTRRKGDLLSGQHCVQSCLIPFEHE